MTTAAGGAPRGAPGHHHGRGIMTETPADPAAPTTLQITRGQRAEIADIQAELTADAGRHVSTKEVIDRLVSFWKEYHQYDK